VAGDADSRTTEQRRWRQLDAIDLEQRRRHYRETTMAQRIEEALSLSELAAELRRATLGAHR
jgi:hypothetical protein